MTKTYEKDGLVYDSSSQKLYSGQLKEIEFELKMNDPNLTLDQKIGRSPVKDEERSVFSKTITNYRDGIKDGIEEKYIREKLQYKEKFKKGKKEISEVFVDDKLYERIFYENEKKISEENYDRIDGKLIRKIFYYDSSKESFYPNGKLEKRENYLNNTEYSGSRHFLRNRDRISESFYQNGQLKSKENYSNGRLLGLQEYFFKNGQLKERFIEGDNKDYSDLEGLEEVYYENGNLKLKRIHTKGKHKTFSEKIFYENGQIESKGNYKGGDKVGLWVTYYENGQIKQKGNYVYPEKWYDRGLKTGVWIQYEEDGKIKSKKTHDESIQRKVRISQSMRDEIGEELGGSDFMTDDERDVFGD